MKRSSSVSALGWTAVIGANAGILALTAYFVMRQEPRDDCKPTVIYKTEQQCLERFDSLFCNDTIKNKDVQFLKPTWTITKASCQATYGDFCVKGTLFFSVSPIAFAAYTSKKDNKQKLEGVYQKPDNQYYYADGKLAPKETTSPNCAVQQATRSGGGGGSGGYGSGGGSGQSTDGNSTRGGFGSSAYSGGG